MWRARPHTELDATGDKHLWADVDPPPGWQRPPKQAPPSTIIAGRRRTRAEIAAREAAEGGPVDTRTARDLGVSDLDDPHDGRPWSYVRCLPGGRNRHPEWIVCIRGKRTSTCASIDRAAALARARNTFERAGIWDGP